MTTTAEVRDVVTATTLDPLTVHLDRLEATLDRILSTLTHKETLK